MSDLFSKKKVMRVIYNSKLPTFKAYQFHLFLLLCRRKSVMIFEEVDEGWVVLVSSLFVQLCSWFSPCESKGKKDIFIMRASKLLCGTEKEIFGCLNSDTAFDVLALFPVKDLLVLKSVSKEWHSLISDRTFVRAQSQKEEPLSGFFFQQRYQWSHDDMKTISYIPIEWKGTTLQQEVFNFLLEDIVVLSSCNGLVCCRSCIPFREPAIYVCNPLKKEWSKLDWSEPHKEDSVALVFDPLQDFAETTNFEVVRLSQCMTEQEELYFSFDIYSSKTRKWNKSKEICWCSNDLYKNKGIFIEGVLHWLTDGNKILTFNVESELAWLILGPFPVAGFNSVPEACIGESGGRLHYVMISEEGLHIWSLDDYFDFSWSLKYSKSLAEMEEEHPKFMFDLLTKVTERLTVSSSPWMDPLAFKDGILLLRVSCNVYLYCIGSSEMKEVCYISKFGSSSMFSPIVLPYQMSLVPLNLE